MSRELYELYERNFPFIVREKETVLRILQDEGNTFIEHRDKQNKLIGISVVNQNTVLLLCVDAAHRNKGIGTKLLAMSEDAVRAGGYDRIVIGNGFDYIMPGVPTSKRYVDAENEELYPGLDETASDFFAKRGYTHSWQCNCFDMRFPLNRFERDTYYVGDTIEGITYRFAAIDDLEEICACTDDACPEFTQYYRSESLYTAGNDTRVLIAVSDGQVVGTLIVGVEDAGKHLGSVGCTTVKRAYQGRHIAVNLVTIGTKYLCDIGFEEAYLSYTYTGLDHMYGYAGYKICIYFMMAEKEL